ncbi:MAG: hypothetical protein DRO67_01755 [Candidatus Asgardarchaeum californiense]|nr:MAG: hypothetical protein DRO67_01755 [Candidatus Asgardarchaeum californiense]
MLFEFKCEKCDEITESIEKSYINKIECPKCGSSARKIMSAVNFRIHGFNAENNYSHKKDVKPKKDGSK